MRAQLFCERSLVLPAAESHGLEAHSTRILHTEMPQSADALDGDDITVTRARIAQCIVNRHTRAHEGTRLFRWQVVRNRRQRFRRGDHVFGITAIKVDTGDFTIAAHRKLAAAALFTDKIMPAVPADPDALPFFPIRDTAAKCINVSRNFVARHARILQAGPETLLDQYVAVANAA